jgi:hypothetical protein
MTGWRDGHHTPKKATENCVMMTTTLYVWAFPHGSTTLISPARKYRFKKSRIAKAAPGDLG